MSALIVHLLMMSEPAVGRMAGTVTDRAGNVVAGALVVAEASDGRDVARTAEADHRGTFTLEGVPVGHYRVTAEVPGRSAPPVASVAVSNDGQATVALTTGDLPPPPRRVRRTTGGALVGIPLWRRSPAAALRFTRLVDPWWSSRPRVAGAVGDPEWRLDGFDFTDPVTGGAAIAIGLDAPATLTVADGLSDDARAWAPGAIVDLQVASGANRYDAAAFAIGSADPGVSGGAAASGAVIRDRLWFSFAGEASGGERHALGKLTWQAGARHKLNLAAVHGSTPGRLRTFAGLRWETLVTDNVVLDATASFLGDHASLKVPRASLKLQVSAGADHETTATVRGALVTTSSTSVGRVQALLQHRWRPLPPLTLGGSVGVAPVPGVPGAGWSGGGFVAWDATGDGRSALRARVATISAPGLIPDLPPCTDCALAARIDEMAAGVSREVLAGLATGVELARRRRSDALAAGAIRETSVSSLVAHLDGRSGPFRVGAHYRLRLSGPSRHEAAAVAGVGIFTWLSLGGSLLHAPRASWAPLFAETAAIAAATGDGGSGWLLGLQLRAELGGFFGFPIALWVDALNLLDDGAATTGAVATPPRQARLGIRIEI